jgi:hypothetical protein
LEPFDETLATAATAPEYQLVDINDAGGLAAVLRRNWPPDSIWYNIEIKKAATFCVVS